MDFYNATNSAVYLNLTASRHVNMCSQLLYSRSNPNSADTRPAQ